MSIDFNNGAMYSSIIVVNSKMSYISLKNNEYYVFHYTTKMVVLGAIQISNQFFGPIAKIV